MKAAWVRPGGPGWPDLNKAGLWGINTLFYDPEDPAVNAKFFDDLRAPGHNIRPGIMRGPSGTAVDLARDLDADLVRLGSANKTCTVMADIEAMWLRGSQFILDWLTEWRKLRPTRATIWTTEPFQGGTINDALVARINADPNLLVVPQLYFFNMSDVVESRCVLDLAKRKINPDRIYPFYDAEDMPSAWDGITFDFNKLPPSPHHVT